MASGIACFENAEYAEAIAWFDEELVKDPQNSTAWQWKGQALAAIGQLEDARAALDEALVLAPSDRDSRYYRAEVATERQDYESAYDDLTWLMQNEEPGYQVMMLRAWVNLRMLRNPHEALADAKGATHVWNDRDGQAAAHCLVARILAAWPNEEFRDADKAQIHARRAFELTEGKLSMPMAYLAMAYAEAGDFSQAIRWQQKAIGAAEDEDRKCQHERVLDSYRSGKHYRESAEIRYEML